MGSRRMLLVEDDSVQREKTAEALRSREWDVETAANGSEAIEKLRSQGSAYDVVVLDLRMPELSGDEVLERIQDEELQVPPVIVLSAYLDSSGDLKCKYLGAACVLRKPYDPSHLDQVARTVAAGAPLVPREIEFDDALLDYMVRRREAALRDRLVRSAETDRRGWVAPEPTFAVVRRWNSWYPSVYPVTGGAYVVVGPEETTPSREATPRRTPVAVIDPGFQCLKALMDIGVPWRDLDCCVITHNHPDHMGGVFELMAARHALGRQTRVLCSSACCVMLGNCSGFNFEVKEIDQDFADLIPAYHSNGRWVRVRIKGFDTAHEEIGRENSSKGLCVVNEAGVNRSALEESGELVVLGDTEYDRAEHRDRFMTALCRPNVKVVVLHVGSSQLKQGTGKHLYLPGLKNILSDMDGQLAAMRHHGDLLVLLSEWGFEHATKEQVRKAFGTTVSGFNGFSPIIEMVRSLQRHLKKIRLIPADIGLVVGIESGKVYVDGVALPAEDVRFDVTEDGVAYESIRA